MVNNLYSLSNEKYQHAFILNYRGVREEVWGKGG